MTSDSSPVSVLADSWPLLRRYFDRHLQLLPAPYSSQDCNRVTIAHFALCGLDAAARSMRDALPAVLCSRVVSWLYGQQVAGGFRGGPFVGAAVGGEWQAAHLASTYSALVTLLTAGDGLQGVARPSVFLHIRSLQRPDGSVACMAAEAAEADLRFVYCAAACLHLLGDGALSHLDVDRLQEYVLRCQSYEGGFGLTPYGEAHGGATYLAVATLHIAGRLQSALSGGGQRRRRLLAWCMARQGGGYTGRANKPVDSCYSFWLGATLQLMHADTLTAPNSNLAALLGCFDDQRGGFGKEAELLPDIMHSYLGTLGANLCQHALHQQQQQQQQQAAQRDVQQPPPHSLPRDDGEAVAAVGSADSALASPAVVGLPALPFDVALGVRR